MKVIRFLRVTALGLGALALAACGNPATSPNSVPKRPGVQVDPANALDPAKTAVVALLVPSGSGDAQRNALGQTLVNAARLAAADIRGATIELKVYETAGDPTRAQQAATMALADGAQIIVGPLFGVAAKAVGPIAAAKGVNVLTFSTTPSVAGRNVFLLGVTADTEADRILSYAKSRGLNSLGVFYPKTPTGIVAFQAATAAARKYNIPLTASLSYPRSFQGIQTTAQQYRALHNAEALLLPEGGQGLRSVASFLQFYGVSPRQTRFIGLGQWNAAITQQEAALHGGWFVAPDPSLFNTFAARYQSAYGANPPRLAALAYDGIAAVGAMLKSAREERNPDGLSAEAITDPGGFVGVNGVFRLRRDGMIDRALAVLEVGPNGFRVIDPAPKGFAPTGS